MAKRVKVVYKDGAEEYINESAWFPDNHWVHFVSPTRAIPVIKDIHQEQIATIEFVDIPRASLEALEDTG